MPLKQSSGPKPRLPGGADDGRERLGAEAERRDRARNRKGGLLASVADVEATSGPGFPFRLRHVLLLALFGATAWAAAPRLAATWRLQGAATQLADYGRCMAGPTGAAAMRDRWPEFERLVRRRLVGSAPGDAPFERCAKLALALSDDSGLSAAHEAPAEQFAEYAGGLPKPSYTLAALGVDRRRVAELAARAWPFVRGGYSRLIKPSSHGPEAAHPLPPPRPSVGHGLPTRRARYRQTATSAGKSWLGIGLGANREFFVSADQGVTWRRATDGPRALDTRFGSCVTGEETSLRFRGSPTGKGPIAYSLDAAGDSVYETPVLDKLADLEALACGGEQALAVLRTRQRGAWQVAVCPFAGPCSRVGGPTPGAALWSVAQDVDVAWQGRTALIAVLAEGVVRVSSSRNGGQSWMPWVVAYDRGELPSGARTTGLPSRLLALKDRILLHGVAESSREPYALLVSTDSGVSFRPAD